MKKSEDHNRKSTLMTRFDFYIDFHERTEQIINSSDDQLLEIHELDRDIGKILEVTKMYKIPGEDLTKQSIYALLLSIMANAKANRAHYIALKALIQSMDEFIDLYQCS